MPRRLRIGVIVYREKDEEGKDWFIAVEPLSGAQAQGETIEEALQRIGEEVAKMQDAWCESELREAVEAKLLEVELPD